MKNTPTLAEFLWIGWVALLCLAVVVLNPRLFSGGPMATLDRLQKPVYLRTRVPDDKTNASTDLAFTSDQGWLKAVGPNGNERWRLRLPADGPVQTQSLGAAVYLLDRQGRVLAVNPKNGDVYWFLSLDATPTSSLLITPEIVGFSVERDGQTLVEKINRFDGTLL